jgi:DNA-binding transcriptional MerR regulator
MERTTDYLLTSQVAKLLRIPKRTLNHLVRTGRVPEPKQGENGYRYWTQHDINLIRALQLEDSAQGDAA